MVFARIKSIASYLPDSKLTNEALSNLFPEWNVEKIFEKTGISSRRISGPDDFSSTLGSLAAKNLFEESSLQACEFDYLVVISQTPDFILPGISNIIHDTLGMREDAGAIDINSGCSGYIYGLSFAKGLIETGQANNVLLITTDTYSKILNSGDKSVRTIFGDGATASWVSSDGDSESLQAFVFGTDGSRGPALVVPKMGLRKADLWARKADSISRGLTDETYDLYMDGPTIFSFTQRQVPKLVEGIISKAGFSDNEIDLFVFHQANAFVLESLRKKLGLPKEKVPILMKNWGNTVSSTIPMALRELVLEGAVNRGTRVLTAGFGVGLSWAGCIIEWE